MDTLELAQTFELVTCRHSRRSANPRLVRLFNDRNPDEDSRVGSSLLFHDWLGNHCRYVS
jgi:hypothetical protein